MLCVLTIGLGVLYAAFAQAPSDGPPIPVAPLQVEPSVSGSDREGDEQGFGRQLSQAKALYFSGEMLEAARRLSDLWTRMQQGEDPGPEARREALTYLCEIRYRQNSLDVAEAVLRWLFARDPDATISPFHHPLEVVTFFRKVQSIVEYEREREELVPVRDGPPPLWTYLPLGIPQARQDRTGAAVAFGSLQVAFAAASIGTWIHVNQLNRLQPQGDLTNEERRRRILVRTYAVNWPLSAMFWGTWLLSTRDAQRYRRRVGDLPVVELLPVGPAGTPGLTVVGRFGRRRPVYRPPSP